MSDQTEKVDKVKEKLEEELFLFSGDDFNTFFVRKVPTGIFSFDIASKGGVPEDRIIEFYGAKSSSKTTSAFRVMNSFHKRYPEQRSLYVDFERTYDPDWSQYFIEDLSRTNVLRPDYGEEGIEHLLKLSRFDEYRLIVIDSLAAMVPLAMTAKSVAEDTMGLHPKLVNKLLRNITPVMSMRRKNNNPITLLILNHYTDKIGAYGAAAFVPVKPGGNMKEFLYTMNVRFKMKEATKEVSPVKWTYSFVIEKNKTRGGSRISGEYTMYQQEVDGFKVGDLDEFDFIEKVAKKVEVLKRIGNKWQVFEQEFKNLEAFQEMLKGDKEFCRKVREDTLEKWVVGGSTNG